MILRIASHVIALGDLGGRVYPARVLLERDGLREALRGQVDAAADGRGSLVLVSGEAGAGKTTLVNGLIEELDHSVLVVIGACDPLTTPRPLGPLYDVAADPDSGFGDLRLGQSEAADVFSDVLERLHRTVRPIVLVIEDIHWSDEATRDFLRFIGRRIGGSRSVLLCTYRDDEVVHDHPLRSALGQLTPLESTHRFAVPPLSVEAVARLAGDSGVDASELHRVTGGNAFFVTEVLESGSAMPGTVQDAVMARVAGLGAAAKRVVEAVSVAPRELEIPVSATLAGADADSVDEAVGSGVLMSDGLCLRFRHELARSAVEDSMPPARRLGLHLEIIDLLEEGDSHDIARLAHHAVRAGNAPLIARYAPEAADEALARGARREAIAFWRSALEYPEELAAGTEAGTWFALGRELRVIEEFDESADALERAIALYRSEGDVRSVGRALIYLQSAVMRTSGEEAGWATIDEALRILVPLGPTEELALAHYRVAHNQMIDRQLAPARRAVDVAREIAEEVGSTDVGWRSDMMAGAVEIVMGDSSRGADMLDRSVATAEEMGDLDMVSIALGMLGSGAGEARLYDRAVPALERGVDHAVATDDDGNAAYNRAWLARVAFEQGDWDRATELAVAALHMAKSDRGISAVTALCALGRVRVRRGDPGALDILDDVLAGADDDLFQYVWNAYCGRAEHAWLRGEHEQVHGLLRHAYARALATDSPWARGEVGFWMWRTGALESPAPGAAAPFARQIAGDWRGAAERWRTIGCPYEVAMALADGDETAMLESVEIFDRLGAMPAARRVRSVLRDAGVDGVPRGPTRATLANPANLTPRQLEVLQLMALGLSNAEIADRLFVSKKTVEHHVSAVYDKLDVTSRTKAMAVAAALGIVEI